MTPTGSPWFAAAASLWLVAAFAADDPPVRDFGFGPKEIYEFKRSTEGLHVQDLNGDGRDDIVFINNISSRLEALVRRADAPRAGDELPLLEESFVDGGFVVDQMLQAGRVADFDGDQRPDILTFGATLGLQLRLQTDEGAYAAPVKIHARAVDEIVDLDVGDLDGDGAIDLLLCRADGADVLWNDGRGAFAERDELRLSVADCDAAELADVNADGVNDLVFFFPYGELPLRIRLGEGERVFGLELALAIPPMTMTKIVRMAGEPPRLGGILQNGEVFRLYRFAAKRHGPIFAAPEIVPLRLSLQGMGKGAAPAWATGDFNADGYDDLCVAAPELSQIHIYHWGPDGLSAAPTEIDSLTGITELQASAAGDIVVYSPKEKALAIHAAGRLADFPRLRESSGRVLACAVDQATDRLYSVISETNGLRLAVGPVDASAINRTLELKLANEPTALRVLTLPGGDAGILLFMPYVPAACYRLNADGLHRLAAPNFRVLTESVPPKSLLFPPGDQGADVIVANGRVARRYAWNGATFAPVKQYNPARETARLVAGQILRREDEPDAYLFYDEDAGDLIHFAGDPVSPFRVHVRGGIEDLAGIVQLRHGDDGDGAVLLVGRTEILLLQEGLPSLAAEVVAEHTSPAEKAAQFNFEHVRVGNAKRSMIALMDQANRSIELVSYRNGALALEVAFEIFQDSGFGQNGLSGGVEPHDVASGDVNGDGTNDLVVLVHDKLIIYPGE